MGRIDRLESLLAHQPVQGKTGIGHTRWATHGPATDENAHPHLGGDGAVAVVHNGVIENFQVLKTRLEAEGFTFHSATDTEVIAHLVASCIRHLPPAGQLAAEDYQPLVAAVQGRWPNCRGPTGW